MSTIRNVSSTRVEHWQPDCRLLGRSPDVREPHPGFDGWSPMKSRALLEE